jgi:hypothetical protein
MRRVSSVAIVVVSVASVLGGCAGGPYRAGYDAGLKWSSTEPLSDDYMQIEMNRALINSTTGYGERADFNDFRYGYLAPIRSKRAPLLSIYAPPNSGSVGGGGGGGD